MCENLHLIDTVVGDIIKGRFDKCSIELHTAVSFSRVVTITRDKNGGFILEWYSETNSLYQTEWLVEIDNCLTKIRHKAERYADLINKRSTFGRLKEISDLSITTPSVHAVIS